MRRKPPKVFYGWWIVTSCFVTGFYHGGTVVYGFTAFFEPIAREFGWSYTQVSLAASLRGLETGLMSPAIGFLVDRFGPRKLMVAGTILFGLGVFSLKYTNSLGMYYFSFFLIALGLTGGSPTVMMTAVAHWFRKHMGLATGLMGAGAGLGGLLIPVVVRSIDTYGWRDTAMFLAIGVWIIGIPLSLIIRHKPEQYGYKPDGAAVTQSTADKQAVAPAPVTADADIGVKEALIGCTFWHITVPMTLNFLAAGAVTVHVMPYLSDIGIGRTTAGLVTMSIPLMSIVGRVGAGWFGDRLDKRWVSTVCFLMVTAGMLVFRYVSADNMLPVIMFVVLFSVRFGGNNTLRASFLRQYFGRRNFGSILGIMMGLLSLGSILGPFLTGLIRDNLGSYHQAWLIFAAANLVSVLIMATTPKPQANKLNSRT